MNLVNPSQRGNGQSSMVRIVNALGHNVSLGIQVSNRYPRTQLTEPGDQNFAISIADYLLVAAVTVTKSTSEVRFSGCLDASGSPAKKFSFNCNVLNSKSPPLMSHALIMWDIGKKRAIKYGEFCECIYPRRSPGYRSNSAACDCQSPSCPHASPLPPVDKRDKNAQAKRIARDLDRGPPPPPIPPIRSLPLHEYFQAPIEMRKTRAAEKKARERSHAVRFEMARANLLNYVEPVFLLLVIQNVLFIVSNSQKYKSESTEVWDPIFYGGPTRASFDMWRCPVSTTETGLFGSSTPLFGIDFDSHGVGVWRNNCRALVLQNGAGKKWKRKEKKERKRRNQTAMNKTTVGSGRSRKALTMSWKNKCHSLDGVLVRSSEPLPVSWEA
ncbi:hypothetical protein FB451DRAFT_1195779 [Mycena latifolia]|nr:hypothetical protein FB451DRAFT_1195779 [Mycena latifolia]